MELLESTSKGDKRSSSVDVASETSRELKDHSNDHCNSAVTNELPILSLAQDVAAAAISTAEKTMKSASSKKSSAKKGEQIF